MQSGQDDRSIRENIAQGAGFVRNPEIKGAVPGPKGRLVLVRSAAKPLTQREAK